MALEAGTPRTTAEKRREAEARLAAGDSTVMPLSPDDVAGIVHELRVHQIELEMQNEELQAAQRELEISRDRYGTLYH